jgi:hypothetical protein
LVFLVIYAHVFPGRVNSILFIFIFRMLLGRLQPSYF